MLHSTEFAAYIDWCAQESDGEVPPMPFAEWLKAMAASKAAVWLGSMASDPSVKVRALAARDHPRFSDVADARRQSQEMLNHMRGHLAPRQAPKRE